MILRSTRITTALLRTVIAAAGLLPWLFLLLGNDSILFKPIFRSFCHQLPDRTLIICHTPMLVCSRCAGIFLGIAVGALTPSFGWLVRNGRGLVMTAVGAMLLDVITQDLGLHDPLHSLRLATGFALGWSASAFLFGMLTHECRSWTQSADRLF